MFLFTRKVFLCYVVLLNMCINFIIDIYMCFNGLPSFSQDGTHLCGVGKDRQGKNVSYVCLMKYLIVLNFAHRHLLQTNSSLAFIM